MPEKFQEEFLLYRWVTETVEQYMAEVEKSDIFACDLKKNLLYGGNEFILVDQKQTRYEYPITLKNEIHMRQDNYKLKLEGKENTLYLDINIENAENEKDKIVMEEKGKRDIDNEKETFTKSSDIQIPADFTAHLLLYEYIEYGLRKYSEDSHSNDRYFCDIEENILPYDTELCMNSASEEPFKTDLAKEIISELSNNLYKF